MQVEARRKGAGELLHEPDLRAELEAEGFSVSSHLLPEWTRIPGHLHAEETVLLVLGGRLRVRAGESEEVLEEGRSVALDAGESHELEVASPVAVRYLLGRKADSRSLPSRPGVRVLLLALLIFLVQAWIGTIFDWDWPKLLVSGVVIGLLPQLLERLPGGAETAVGSLFEGALLRMISTRSLATLWGLFLLAGFTVSGVELVGEDSQRAIKVDAGRDAWAPPPLLRTQDRFLINPFGGFARISTADHEDLIVPLEPWRLSRVDLRTELLALPSLLIRVGHNAHVEGRTLEVVHPDATETDEVTIFTQDLPADRTAYYLGPGLEITSRMLDDWALELARYRPTPGDPDAAEINERVNATMLAWRHPRRAEGVERPLRAQMRIQVRLAAKGTEGEHTISCLTVPRLGPAATHDVHLTPGTDLCD